jgi:predicted Zn finger-like uncharacterized protein
MAETQITRCPHCQTTFRIRLEQLSAAKGAVRCGSCLQVFKAVEHLVSEKPKVSAPAPAKPVLDKPVDKEPKKDICFDDIPDQIADDPLEDLGIRAPERDHEETFDNGLQLDDSVFSMQENAKPSRYSLHEKNNDIDFDLTDDFNDDLFSSDSFGSHSSQHETWASGLINDDSDQSAKTSVDDESWADELLNIDDDLIEDIDTSFDKKHVVKEEDDFVPSLDDDLHDDQFQLGGNDDVEQEEIEFTIADSINDLHDEPLKLNKEPSKNSHAEKATSYTWLWLSASLVMIAVMISQVSYFKFDNWSRHPDYRPVYTMSCEILGCSLPAIQDVNKMNTQHFMVRPHPEVKQALYIDTLLINNASYQQPFPDLKLVFTGLENQIIASRRFKPKEYLAGELAGVSVMPQNVPIHIAFEILNPGAEAVSYRIELAANH